MSGKPLHRSAWPPASRAASTAAQPLKCAWPCSWGLIPALHSMWRHCSSCSLCAALAVPLLLPLSHRYLSPAPCTANCPSSPCPAAGPSQCKSIVGQARRARGWQCTARCPPHPGCASRLPGPQRWATAGPLQGHRLLQLLCRSNDDMALASCKLPNRTLTTAPAGPQRRLARPACWRWWMSQPGARRM